MAKKPESFTAAFKKLRTFTRKHGKLGEALRSRRVRKTWGDHFSELVEFRRAKGHVNISHSHECSVGLKAWCAAQRHAENRGLLASHLVYLLDLLGFQWSGEEYKDALPAPTERHRSLAGEIARAEKALKERPRGTDEKYLALFKLHSERSMQSGPPEPVFLDLATWLCDRLGMWEQGSPTPEPLVEQFRKLGFTQGSGSERSWDGWARVLEDHMQRFGARPDRDSPLGRWLERQTKAMLTGNLPAFRRVRLSAMGDVWALPKGRAGGFATLLLKKDPKKAPAPHVLADVWPYSFEEDLAAAGYPLTSLVFSENPGKIKDALVRSGSASSGGAALQRYRRYCDTMADLLSREIGVPVKDPALARWLLSHGVSKPEDLVALDPSQVKQLKGTARLPVAKASQWLREALKKHDLPHRPSTVENEQDSPIRPEWKRAILAEGITTPTDLLALEPDRLTAIARSLNPEETYDLIKWAKCRGTPVLDVLEAYSAADCLRDWKGMSSRIQDRIAKLSPASDAAVVRRYLTTDETMDAVGKKQKLTRERVRQITSSALKSMVLTDPIFFRAAEKLQQALRRGWICPTADVLQTCLGAKEDIHLVLKCLSAFASGIETLEQEEKSYEEPMPVWLAESVRSKRGNLALDWATVAMRTADIRDLGAVLRRSRKDPHCTIAMSNKFGSDAVLTFVAVTEEEMLKLEALRTTMRTAGGEIPRTEAIAIVGVALARNLTNENAPVDWFKTAAMGRIALKEEPPPPPAPEEPAPQPAVEIKEEVVAVPTPEAVATVPTPETVAAVPDVQPEPSLAAPSIPVEVPPEPQPAVAEPAAVLAAPSPLEENTGSAQPEPTGSIESSPPVTEEPEEQHPVPPPSPAVEPTPAPLATPAETPVETATDGPAANLNTPEQTPGESEPLSPPPAETAPAPEANPTEPPAAPASN
jgi:hypothetical protein